MKEFVFVEFLFTSDEYGTEFAKLSSLGTDFEYIKSDYEYETDIDHAITEEYVRVAGKINSMAASLIKLQNPTLAGKMRISYITEEMKNRYRR